MANPLISVVVVTYNQENYIRQTLDSVLAQQTEYDFEIVIGEDCSTDNTREKVFSCQQEHPDRIKVVISDSNVGLLKNYHRTIQQASGKYIACCAGDDFWHAQDKLQAQVSFLEKNPDYGLVHSGATLIDENGKFIKRLVPKTRELNPDDSPLPDLLVAGGYPVFASTAVFRKDLFDRYFDFDELTGNGIVMEDTPFLIEMAVHSRIYYIERSLIMRRLSEGTISNPIEVDKKLAFVNASQVCLEYYYSKYQDRLQNPAFTRDMMEKNVNRAIASLAFQYNQKALFFQSYRALKVLNDLQFRDHLNLLIILVPFGSGLFRKVRALRQSFLAWIDSSHSSIQSRSK